MCATSHSFFLQAGAWLILSLAVWDDFQEMIGGDWDLLSRLDVVQRNKFRRQIKVERFPNLQHPAIFRDGLRRILALRATV